MPMKPRLISIALLLGAVFVMAPARLAGASLGLSDEIVADTATVPGAFPLVTADRLAPLWHESADYPGVTRAVADLQADIERVTSRRPVATTTRPVDAAPVIIGTLGRNATIDALVA